MTISSLRSEVSMTARILVALTIVGLTFASVAGIAEAASRSSCAKVRSAISVATEVPAPGQKWHQSALAVLSAKARKVIIASRASFLAAVAKQTHADWAAVNAAYRQQVAKAKRGLASKPSPPPPQSHYDADVIAALTPGWQSYASAVRSTILKANHCTARRPRRTKN